MVEHGKGSVVAEAAWFAKFCGKASFPHQLFAKARRAPRHHGRQSPPDRAQNISVNVSGRTAASLPFIQTQRVRRIQASTQTLTASASMTKEKKMKSMLHTALVLPGMMSALAMTPPAMAKYVGNSGPTTGQVTPGAGPVRASAGCHRECDWNGTQYLVCVSNGVEISRKQLLESCIH
jgi:hypothetical protein